MIKVEYQNWFRDHDGNWTFDLVVLVFNSKEQAEREIAWRHFRERRDTTYWVTDLDAGKVIETNDKTISY